MRHIVPLLAVLLAAACSKPAGDPQPVMRQIDCALAGSQAFTPDCRVEQAGSVLVVHHKDGGFRRLQKVDDGRGVIVADGVEQARVAWIPDGRLEVTVGQDRYRFPAKVKP
ncbi:hypothetical protein [Novosphingobium cyanobacteriorum]|uniref:Lipoprotein n=1 Tax=Novosphingobium cyanobacteriorum TaxID=3024215 RepID=A0ABT6CJ28_9SPHN|nr:hypothetical protein [Novosphingobium cyanobacteriorum]MDF8333921.1 hypothetical protein [Novosphingobium cyanobacteriorum]